MLLTLLALQLLSPTIARSVENGAQEKDTKQGPPSATVRPDLFASAFNDNLRIPRQAGFVGQTERTQGGFESGYIHENSQTNPAHKSQPRRKPELAMW